MTWQPRVKNATKSILNELLATQSLFQTLRIIMKTACTDVNYIATRSGLGSVLNWSDVDDASKLYQTITQWRCLVMEDNKKATVIQDFMIYAPRSQISGPNSSSYLEPTPSPLKNSFSTKLLRKASSSIKEWATKKNLLNDSVKNIYFLDIFLRHGYI